MTAPQLEQGEQPDTDLRELQFKKSNYGPISHSIVLRYQNGLFLRVHGLSNVDKAAREVTVEEALISIGKKLIERGQTLSPAEQSHSYAPSFIAKQPEARGIKKSELKAALGRLLDCKVVYVDTLKPGTAREKKVLKFS